jgi:hypothetical protein
MKKTIKLKVYSWPLIQWLRLRGLCRLTTEYSKDIASVTESSIPVDNALLEYTVMHMSKGVEYNSVQQREELGNQSFGG